MEQSGAEGYLEERVELSLLYDFYGALLKENQRRMFEANVLEDYSLTEIAEEEGISRQGVYDAVKRASGQLKRYEERLGLVKRFQRQNTLVRVLRERLTEFEGIQQEDGWQEIRLLLEELLEEEF